MTAQEATAGTKAGTIGGTLLTIVANLDSSDLVRTVILATVGAVVSFVISLGLKLVVKWLKSSTGSD